MKPRRSTRNLVAVLAVAALAAVVSTHAPAAGVSTYASQAIGNQVYRSGSALAPSTICWALTTAAANDASTGATIAEPTYTGYARGQLNPSTSNYTSPTSTGQVCNNATITFGTAATAGTTTVVTGFAALDSCTIGQGNVIVYGPLAAAKTINPPGDPAPTAPANSLCSALGD